MCRAAQESGAPHREYIDRKKENVISHFCISVISYPIETKFTAELPANKGSLHSKFEGNHSSHFRDMSGQIFFFFVFSHTCKNSCKTQTRTPIALKFGTQQGSPKAHPSIKFGANPINGSGVMTYYLRKTRSICCHAYRVNRFME